MCEKTDVHWSLSDSAVFACGETVLVLEPVGWAAWEGVEIYLCLMDAADSKLEDHINNFVS